jgi:8-oxo-dGTP pyrophosphatase MutT (NUDIX family)
MAMSEENPWTTLGSEVRYENPWIRLSHHDVLTPGGSPGIYGTVHFKHLALGVVVLDEEMHTWLVGQWRYPLERYSWEIPEGGGDPDVDPLISIKRELKEETGIEAQDWRFLLQIDLSNSVTDEVARIWLATGLSFGEPEPDDTEALALKRLPFEEAYQMALDGRITDAISVAALLRVKLLVEAGAL